MQEKIKKIINCLFYTLFFLTPLVLHTKTSELFEFNKMIVVYLFTILIITAWLARMIIEKEYIFKRTFLDIPLLVFITSQVLSTLVSIDMRTSIFGYYSRFHGGLLSTLSYLLLYWSFVSNMSPQATISSIYSLLASAILVSIYAILQKLGMTKKSGCRTCKTEYFLHWVNPIGWQHGS